jgi:uncharacterized coiled-coil protein SlyX
MLADANRQLLERDEEVLNIIAVREQESTHWRERVELLEYEVQRHREVIESLNRTIAEVHATRVWRLAVQYRRVRDRVKSTLSARARVG